MDIRLAENMPIYIQIKNRIREAIASGELKTGEKIASVRDLASEFEVNPNTMQRALMELEREGLLISERTQGRYVTSDKNTIDTLRNDIASKAVEEFISNMKTLGLTEEEMMSFFRSRLKVLSQSDERDGKQVG